MRVFDIQGGREALREWNEARQVRRKAVDEYEAARDRAWKALVRMAQAHKRGQEIEGSTESSIFMWFDELDGDRDEILRSAASAPSADQ